MRVGTSLSWLWKKIQRPVFIRVEVAKFPPEGEQKPYFRLLPGRVAATGSGWPPRCSEYLNR